MLLDKNVIVTEDNFNAEVYQNDLFNNNLFDKSLLKVNTQKANGVLYVSAMQNKLSRELPNIHHILHIPFKAGQQFAKNSFNFPVFARPCPLNPRHGFVDSTICKDYLELNKLSNDTLTADNDSEILVTKPVNCSYNIIFNDGNITFGEGNDGATSGKNCKYFYVNKDSIGDILNLKNTKLIAEGEAPFYEFVVDKNETVYLVQIRSAPITPKAKDFIPSRVEVRNIIKAEGNLLEWEQRLKTIDPANTVIDHTDGSLSSHYAIHAIINKIPIFTTYLPAIGDIVEPTVVNQDITEEDKKEFFEGFVNGFSSKLKIKEDPAAHFRIIIQTALATLHNYSSLAMMKDYRLLGLVLGLFSKVTFATSAGESRFSRGLNEVKYFSDYYSKMKFSVAAARQPIYNLVFSNDVDFVKYVARESLKTFSYLKWGGSYGGPKWKSCTLSAIELFNACVNRDIKNVVELFNKVINEEHNGGKYLNKCIRVDEFDQAAIDSSKYTINRLANIIDLIYKVSNDKNCKMEFDKFTPIDTTLDITEFNDFNNKAKEKPAFTSATAAKQTPKPIFDQSKQTFNDIISQMTATTATTASTFQYATNNLKKVDDTKIYLEVTTPSSKVYHLKIVKNGQINIVKIDQKKIDENFQAAIDSEEDGTCLCTTCSDVNKVITLTGKGWCQWNGHNFISKAYLTKLLKTI